MIQDIFYIIWKIIKQFIPPGILTVAEAAKEINPSERLINQLKKKFFDNGWKWQKLNLIALRDTQHPKNKQVYNDIIIRTDGNTIDLFWGNTEPGLKWNAESKKKYGITWVGVYPLGNYPKNFYCSTYKNFPAFRQRGRVLLKNVETGKLQMGGGCHFHLQGDDDDTVGYASAGCQNPKVNEHLKEAHAEFKKAYDKKSFDYTICDIHEFNLIGVRT